MLNTLPRPIVRAQLAVTTSCVCPISAHVPTCVLKTPPRPQLFTQVSKIDYLTSTPLHVQSCRSNQSSRPIVCAQPVVTSNRMCSKHRDVQPCVPNTASRPGAFRVSDLFLRSTRLVVINTTMRGTEPWVMPSRPRRTLSTPSPFLFSPLLSSLESGDEKVYEP